MSRVLILSYLPLYPTDGGGRVRIHQIASRLAERHEVSVLCPTLSERRQDYGFALYDRGISGWKQMIAPQTFRNVIDVASEVRPDVVLLEYMWQGMHAIPLRLLRNVPVVLDAFDVVGLRLRRERRIIWPIVSLYERAVVRAVDRVLAVSDVDRSALIRLGARPETTDIVPNGVDTSLFRPDSDAGDAIREQLDIRDGQRMLFFFGQLDYSPNAHAVGALAEQVMPRLGSEYRLVIAGRGGSAALRSRYESDRVRFVGSVNALPGYINAADAVVAPVKSGSGTRLKILESIACGAPTVTTTLGAEGIDARACGSGLRIVDGWDAFAEETMRATESARTLPPASFAATYDWGAIVGRMKLL